MTVTRRETILAGIGLGVAFAAGSQFTRAGWTGPGRFNSFGVVPSGGATDQTEMLQSAIDAAAGSGLPLFLPPGTYSTRRLEMRSGSHLTGVPGQSILHYRGGGGLIGVEQAADIRLDGLVLDGDGRDMGVDGALLAATLVERLQLSNCRFLRSGSGGILVSRCEDVVITSNIVDKAATGIAVTNVSQGAAPALILGNLVRNLFFRKVALSHGNGIAIDADAVVKGNIVENAPAFGILIGPARRDVSITDNRIRNTHIGIGVAAEIAETARLAGNLISNAQNGCIRAMRGPTPIGPDLAVWAGVLA
ncbi:right-handed parallel beta-helix repeat-containing protein [Methyloceanibacter sp.]|uniref:right-handed parallel beta-helix repeat-containing protein n=1 Tax=Methyloceanibacter sp. TaxID=1965321 RepID=UPI003D6D04C4